MTLAMLLAEVHNSADLSILFVILAFLAFAVAVYLAYVGNFIAAVAAVLIGVVILVVS